MRRARKAILAVAGALVALLLAVAGASALGTARFIERYEAEKADLLRRGRAVRPTDAVPAARDPLPPPIERYLARMRAARVPTARVAILRQRGALRMAADRPWMPFSAEQAYSMEPPGFVWLARAELAPLVHMVARDAFVDGRGHMLVRLLGLVTVADARGGEIDHGAALRYWGEILVFPERVLDPRLRWEPMDDRRVRLTIEQDGLVLSAVVEFEADGVPVAVIAERFRDVGGEGVLTRWSGHFRDWKELGGRPFPTRWESVWHLPEGEFSAVRMEVLSVETD